MEDPQLFPPLVFGDGDGANRDLVFWRWHMMEEQDERLIYGTQNSPFWRSLMRHCSSTRKPSKKADVCNKVMHKYYQALQHVR
jgi:hypothetical protein